MCNIFFFRCCNEWKSKLMWINYKKCYSSLESNIYNTASLVIFISSKRFYINLYGTFRNYGIELLLKISDKPPTMKVRQSGLQLWFNVHLHMYMYTQYIVFEDIMQFLTLTYIQQYRDANSYTHFHTLFRIKPKFSCK